MVVSWAEGKKICKNDESLNHRCNEQKIPSAIQWVAVRILTNDSRLLCSGSLDPSHSRHRRVAGIARSNRLEVIGIITEALLSFKVHPLLLFNPLQFLAELAVGSDSIAVPDERERDDRNTETEEGNKTARPVDTESIEHRLRGEREDGAEDASRTAGGRLSTRGEGLIGVGEVVEHGHEDQQVARAEGNTREEGDDPVDVG